jgi:drug/metabolite transporter (DMT)-like permease
MTAVKGSSAPGRAIALMMGGGMLLTMNDAVMKWLSSGYPVGQLLFTRAMFSFLIIAVFVRFYGGLASLKITNPRLHVMRGIFVLFGTFSFVTGLRYLALADALAVVFAGPLFVTALAPLLIGEPVGWRRWAAVMAGFVGVVIIIRPGSDAMQWAAIFPLASALVGALRDLVTRGAMSTENSNALLATSTAAAAIGGLCTLPFGWEPVAWFDLGLMALSGFLMGGAYFLIIESFRFGEAGLVVPFKYFNMVFAVALGFVLWGDLPDTWTWSGTAVLIGSGLYILHRERKRHMPPSLPPDPQGTRPPGRG